MKKFIAIILAVIMVLPFGAMSCFAAGSNDTQCQVQTDKNGVFYINVYTDEKKQKPSEVNLYSEFRFLLCVALLGATAYYVSGPLIRLKNATESGWHAAGNGSRNIIDLVTKVSNSFKLGGAYVSDFINRNSLPPGEKTQVEFVQEKIANINPQDLTDTEAIKEVVSPFADVGAGAGAVIAGGGSIVALKNGQLAKTGILATVATGLGLYTLVQNQAIGFVTTAGTFLLMTAPKILGALRGGAPAAVTGTP
ncbi:MAG: hypothetical protein RUMPE_00795 [Eubacteriales bacterium SKADARSKE-1]|nr:hypothetical protein [Eubacteriales bacterium SKADARSKE-1]